MEKPAKYQPYSTPEAQQIQCYERGSTVVVFPSGPGHEKPFLGVIRGTAFYGDVNNLTVRVEVLENHNGRPPRIRSLGGGTSAVLWDTSISSV